MIKFYWLTIIPSWSSCFSLMAIASRFFSAFVCCRTSSIYNQVHHKIIQDYMNRNWNDGWNHTKKLTDWVALLNSLNLMNLTGFKAYTNDTCLRINKILFKKSCIQRATENFLQYFQLKLERNSLLPNKTQNYIEAASNWIWNANFTESKSSLMLKGKSKQNQIQSHNNNKKPWIGVLCSSYLFSNMRIFLQSFQQVFSQRPNVFIRWDLFQIV